MTLAVLMLATVVGVAPMANASGADAVDAESVDAESVDAESVDAESVDAESVDDGVVKEAIEALKIERDLTGHAAELRQRVTDVVREQIRDADDHGKTLLGELVADGFEPSAIVRETLGPLRPPSASGVPQPPPTRQQYDQAIRELGGDPGVPPVHAVNDGGWTGAMAAIAAGLAVLSAVAAVTVVVVLRRRTDARLVALAMTDSLTALHNRRRLDDDLTGCTARQRPVGVLMVDVDNFKQVNDLQGHAAGDRVLQHVGAVLAQHIRPNDVAYRYGGEEFCVLLPDATEADAFGVAERVRQATSALRIPGLEPVTVSVGVAIGTGADVQHTLERADAAMYDAKRDGRDRVALASSSVGSGAGHG